MKSYELTYLISSELTEDKAKDLQNKMIALITEEGGILVGEALISKKELAYPVKKLSQAYLATIYFRLLPEKLINLEKRLKAENEILRYLILTKRSLKKIKISRTIVQPGIEKVTGKEKVELKEIEKKLEEILNKSG